MYNPYETYSRIKYVLSIKKVKMNIMLHDLGLSKNYLSQSSKLLTGMSAANLYAISQYLGVSSDYLLGLSNNITNDGLINPLTSGDRVPINENIEQNADDDAFVHIG